MTETVEEEVLDFTSGANNAEEFRKKEQAARDAARGSVKYFGLKNDGDVEILRFLFEANQLGSVDRTQPIGPSNPHDPTTGWIMAKQHNFVATKPAPKDKPDDRDWPDSVGAICRRTPVGGDQRPAYDSCYICDNIKNDKGKQSVPSVSMWASAVLREEVVGSQELVDAGRIAPEQIGKRVIIDQGDWIDEVDTSGTSTGRKVWKRRYVIVNMAMANFFSPLTTEADYRGTILDRDYRITRKGAAKARRVEYVPTALDPYQVTVMRNGQPTVITYDLREPEIAALYADGPKRADLAKIIGRRVSKKFYDRYFDTRVEASWKDMLPDDDHGSTPDKAAADGPASAPPPPSPQQQAGQSVVAEPTEGVTADALAAMRAKVQGMSAGAAAPAIDAPAAPVATPEAPPPPPAQPSAPAAPAVAPAPVATPSAPPLVG